MKHKLTKYLSNGLREKEMINVFVLTAQFGKLKKGEIFEEFYTSGSRYYAISSNLFRSDTPSGNTKIIKGSATRKAPIAFFRKIKKEDSMLWRLHNKGFEDLRPVEYKQMN